MDGLTIGKVAREAGVNIETVRYYEKRGLIPQPPRTCSGYRQYPEKIVQRIKFIKRAQELGFTLKEVQKLLAISDHETGLVSHEIQQFAREKVLQLERKIAGLVQIKLMLESLLSKCKGSGPIQECPIMEKLCKGGELHCLKD